MTTEPAPVESVGARARRVADRLVSARAGLRAALGDLPVRTLGRGAWLCPLCMRSSRVAGALRPEILDLKHRETCPVRAWAEMAEVPQ